MPAKERFQTRIVSASVVKRVLNFQHRLSVCPATHTEDVQVKRNTHRLLRSNHPYYRNVTKHSWREPHCNKVRRKEGSGQGWLVKTQVCLFKTDKLTQVRTLRHPETSTLSFVSAITLCIRSDCFSLTARALESSLRLSLNCRSTAAFIRSPRQLLQSDTGDPHFALDPLTYRCLLSLSPAADFAEPRPPRHTHIIKFEIWINLGYINIIL